MSKRGRDIQNLNPSAQLFRAVGIGVLISVLTIVFLLFISAMIFKISGTISPVTAGAAAIIIAASGGFLGGYTATRILKRAGLITGLLTAILTCVLIFFIGLLLSNNELQLTSLTKHGILLFSGICGGVLGVNHREKHK